MERSGGKLLFSETDQSLAGMPEVAHISQVSLLLARVVERVFDTDETMQELVDTGARRDVGQVYELQRQSRQLNTLASQLVSIMAPSDVSKRSA